VILPQRAAEKVSWIPGRGRYRGWLVCHLCGSNKNRRLLACTSQVKV